MASRSALGPGNASGSHESDDGRTYGSGTLVPHIALDEAGGRGVITVRLRDPWKESVLHHVLTDEAPAITRRRSVMDGRFAIGTDPETGRDLGVVLYDDAGGHHILMVAPTGSRSSRS